MGDRAHGDKRGNRCPLPWIQIGVGAKRQNGNFAAEQRGLEDSHEDKARQQLRHGQFHQLTQLKPPQPPPGTSSQFAQNTFKRRLCELTEQSKREVCFSV